MEERTTYAMFKLIMAKDGSYYVTVPYHPLNKAIATLATMNYAQQGKLGLSDALDTNAIKVTVLDDDDQRLKLSHHPDGFIQFSGEGILSGRNPNGTAKGMGIQSWSLTNPTMGPSFGVSFMEPTVCGRLEEPHGSHLIFSDHELEHMRPEGLRGVRFQGHYLPPHYREFVRRTSSGQYEMGLINSDNHAVLPLKIALGGIDSDFPGIIGLHARPINVNLFGAEAGFILSSSTGNLRRNSRGELLGDGLYCIYPRPNEGVFDIQTEDLQYVANAVPYVSEDDEIPRDGESLQ